MCIYERWRTTTISTTLLVNLWSTWPHWVTVVSGASYNWASWYISRISLHVSRRSYLKAAKHFLCISTVISTAVLSLVRPMYFTYQYQELTKQTESVERVQCRNHGVVGVAKGRFGRASSTRVSCNLRSSISRRWLLQILILGVQRKLPDTPVAMN